MIDKEVLWKMFGPHITTLTLSGYGQYVHMTAAHILVEVVVNKVYVFDPWAEIFQLIQFKCAVVFFKLILVDNMHLRDDFEVSLL